MGLFDSIAGLFDPTSGMDSGAFGFNDVLSLGTDIGTGLGVIGATPVNYFPSYSLPATMSGPISASYPQGSAQPVAMGSVPATALGNVIRGIAVKVATRLGLRSLPSLQKMMRMVRSMAKNGLAPAAVAAALGIAVDELATLITAQARRKTRRMNPANTKALRRSVRRLASFDRLATRVRGQLSSLSMRGSHRRRVGRCTSCKKSPCRC